MTKRKRVYSDYVQDILEEIRLVMEFTQDMDYEHFLWDKKNAASG